MKRFLLLPCVAAAALSFLPGAMADTAAGSDARAAFHALFRASLDNKRALAVHVGGQTIQGAVVRLIGDDAVELRNQQFDHIVVRLDRIDAVAAP